jgi:hypothetical protein
LLLNCSEKPIPASILATPESEAYYSAALSGKKITRTGAEDLVFLALCTPQFQKQFYEAIEA